MKTNWEFLEAHRICFGPYVSSSSDGFNGAFEFAIPGEARRVLCIASDGMGWRHVSVSFGAKSKKTPSWAVMNEVKKLFWGDDEWVVQFHPPRSEYVNNHPGCLHLWQSTDHQTPTPFKILVGHQEYGELK